MIIILSLTYEFRLAIGMEILANDSVIFMDEVFSLNNEFTTIILITLNYSQLHNLITFFFSPQVDLMLPLH